MKPEEDELDGKETLPINSLQKKKYTKTKIPKAVREQVWISEFGRVFQHNCYIRWCQNEINVFDFHVGHDIPESQGGTLSLDNLKPICARCNLSMSDTYTIKDWTRLGKPTSKFSRIWRGLCCR